MTCQMKMEIQKKILKQTQTAKGKETYCSSEIIPTICTVYNALNSL